MKAAGGLRPRRLVEVVPQRMREEPVVILTGPRGASRAQGELHRPALADPARLPEMPSHPVTRDEYVDRILAGGFPLILQRLTTRARTSWFAGYVNLVVMRDVLDIARDLRCQRLHARDGGSSAPPGPSRRPAARPGLPGPAARTLQPRLPRWPRQHQAIRRGCRVHAARTTWPGHPRLMRGGGRRHRMR